MPSVHIPAGYQLHTESWENDADASKTTILSGLSFEDVEFYLDLLSYFRSQNDHRVGMAPGLGNGSNLPETIIAVVKSTLERHPNISADTRATWIDDLFDIELEIDPDDADYNPLADTYYEIICEELLSYPVEDYYASQPYFCRVFDRAKVYFVETPIKNVTSQFIK